MSQYTIEEWWAIYSLRFGPDAVFFEWQEGEIDFLDAVAKDLRSRSSDMKAGTQFMRAHAVLDRFKEIRGKEVRAARKP